MKWAWSWARKLMQGAESISEVLRFLQVLRKKNIWSKHLVVDSFVSFIAVYHRGLSLQWKKAPKELFSVEDGECLHL